eukprot:GHUV01012809.1.p1 GENE.GHUV01012809.1~~GHUV01012809.1.p1  ORF type:complete len:289 (+),score=64.93 GHUV01012809.1:54-920(+)
MAASSQNTKHMVFIVHRGPETKHLALELKQMLEAQGITAFVDEPDLRHSQDAKTVMKQTLLAAKAAIVLFTEDFYTSHWCVEELECVLEQRKKQQVYIPVFLSRTVAEAYADARNHYGNQFADEVTKISGVRHVGENMNNAVWEETAKSICETVAKVPGIKNHSPTAQSAPTLPSHAAPGKLACLSPWQKLQQEYQKLKMAASASAMEIPSKPPSVWILSHTDTAHFAKLLGDLFQSHRVRTFWSAKISETDVTERATELLAAECTTWSKKRICGVLQWMPLATSLLI